MNSMQQLTSLQNEGEGAESLRFMGLVSKLTSAEFVRVEITGDSEDLPAVYVEPLHGEGVARVFQIRRGSDSFSDPLDADQVARVLGTLFEQGYQRATCVTAGEPLVYTRGRQTIHIRTESAAEQRAKIERHFDTRYLVESPKTRAMLARLGVLSEKGIVRREQYNKLVQIKNFMAAISDVLPRLSDRQSINIVDAACGKSYLSFVLYHFLHEEWGFDVSFQCIDTSDRLIADCREIQASLAFEHMQFIECRVGEFSTDARIDLLYSLHGCDTATDEAIAAGVHLGSELVLVVPCCHRELKGQLHDHPLTAMTAHGLFRDRFAALLTDALRVLALEAAGYRVAAFRFVTDDISPKNTLLRAIKATSHSRSALQRYWELRDTFGVSPAIERLLPELLLASPGVRHEERVR